MIIDDLESKEEVTAVMVGVWTAPTAIELLEAAIIEATHLKPLWERIRVEVIDDRAWVGLPITSKVTDENADNHARHFFSLLNLLGVPLAPSPMALERRELVDDGNLKPLFYLDPKVEKEKEKARLAAEAAAAAAAEAEAEAEAK